MNNAGRLEGLGLEARRERKGVRGRGLGWRRAARIKMKEGSFGEEHATPFWLTSVKRGLTEHMQ